MFQLQIDHVVYVKIHGALKHPSKVDTIFGEIKVLMMNFVISYNKTYLIVILVDDREMET